MSSSDLTGFGTDQQRRRLSDSEHDDVFLLQAARITGFGVAVLVVAFHVLALFLQREVDSVFDGSGSLPILGGLAVGFICGQLIKSRRKIAALEKRLAEATGGLSQ